MSELEPADVPLEAEAPAGSAAVGWTSPGGELPAVPAWGIAAQATLPANVPPPAQVKRPVNRKRVMWSVSAAVVVLALVAVGIVVLTPGRSGDSVVAKVNCQPTNLATCLLKAPAGAEPLTLNSPWSKETTTNATLYAATIVNGDTKSLGLDADLELKADSVHRIVHTNWNAVDGDNVELVLIQFDTQKGARAWNSTQAAEILAAYPGQSITIPGDSTGQAHAAAKPSTDGNVWVAYSTVVGNLVLDVLYSSPGQLSAQDLETWAGTELASLRTAPPASPDSPDVAPGYQQVACGGRLTSCLSPIPDGSEHWQSPESKDWVAASRLSPSQYVDLFWSDSANRTVAQGDFKAAGVTGVAHQDWDLDNANEQADIYLIQTVTASGAARLAGQYFTNEPGWTGGASGIAHKVPHEPGAVSWYANKPNQDGLVSGYYTETLGNVIVECWFFFNGSFDAATADNWALSQLHRVSGTVRNEPMGLYPLTAPKLPAAHQGSCPAGGDCLLPLPGGSVDTTSTSYTSSRSLSTLGYSVQYESSRSDEFSDWLTSDGFQSGEHRAWTTNDGVSTADGALLQFAKPAQARAAAMIEYGLNASGDRDCTDSAVPDSFCLASPVSATDVLQNETIWVLAWKGDYAVGVAVTRSGGADVADAYAWAQQQLDLLPAG